MAGEMSRAERAAFVEEHLCALERQLCRLAEVIAECGPETFAVLDESARILSDSVDVLQRYRRLLLASMDRPAMAPPFRDSHPRTACP